MSWEIQVRLRLGALQLEAVLHGDQATVALIGPNGSGKSTLLRAIAGAHRPEAGRIRFGDAVFCDSERGIDLVPEERRVGYLPQGYGLFPHLSVLDNVGFGWAGGSRKAPRERRRQAALELLEGMGCGHLAPRRPSTLSGGEQQRVALARALMIEPRVLLLDEPLAALDAAARRSFRSYLADRLAERESPTIVVTHDARDVLALGARVIVIEDGRVAQEGSAESLRTQPATAFVAEFFDSPTT